METRVAFAMKNFWAEIPQLYEYWLETISVSASGKILYGVNLSRNLKYYTGAGLQTGWHSTTERAYNVNDTVHFNHYSNSLPKSSIVVNSKFSKPSLSNNLVTGLMLKLKNNQSLKLTVSGSCEYVFKTITDFTYTEQDESSSEGKIIAAPFSYSISLSYTFVQLGKKATRN